MPVIIPLAIFFIAWLLYVFVPTVPIEKKFTDSERTSRVEHVKTIEGAISEANIVHHNFEECSNIVVVRKERLLTEPDDIRDYVDMIDKDCGVK